MADLDLTWVKEVRVVDALLREKLVRRTNEATAELNKLLSEGWKLLKIAESSFLVQLDHVHEVDGLETDCHYILGR